MPKSNAAADAQAPEALKVEPGPTEDQKTFMARCMSAEKDSLPDQKQRVAACFSMWRRKTGGKEPKSSAAPILSVFNVAQGVELRREQLNGVEHLVLPMVALIQGVYTCANCAGPNLYQAREFAKHPAAWNGRPVTVGHPMRDGAYVSAGSPDVWQTERVGTTFNAALDGDKLRIEAWLDTAALERAGGDAADLLAAVEACDEVEVSTAAWIDEKPMVGVHSDGRQYQAVQVNFQPDHVAILPLGQIGACSWADGCGVRVASSGEQPKAGAPSEVCCDACARGEPCEASSHPHIGETARDLEQALRQALLDTVGGVNDGMTPTYDPWVRDHDDEYVYYETRKGTFRRTWSVDDAGKITLGDAADEVRAKTEYVVVNKQEDGEMADDPKKGATAPESPPSEPAKKADDAKAPEALTSSDKKVAELSAQVEHLTAKLAAQAQPKTLEDYIAQAPEEVREGLMQLHKAQARRKLELVDAVKASPGCMWPEDELKTKSVEELERLASLATRANYGVTPPERSRMIPLEDDDYMAVPPSAWDKPASAS